MSQAYNLDARTDAQATLRELARRVLPDDDQRLGIAGNVSQKRMQGARAEYLRLQEGETLLALLDESVFNTGKAGIALTDRRIQFKESGHQGVRTYAELGGVKLLPGRLVIDDQTQLSLTFASSDVLCALAVFMQRAHTIATGRDPLIAPEPGRWMLRSEGIEGPYSRAKLDQRLAETAGDCQVWRTWMADWAAASSLQAFAEVPASKPGAPLIWPRVTPVRLILYVLGAVLERAAGLLVAATALLVLALYRTARLNTFGDNLPSMIAVFTVATCVFVWMRWLGRRLENVLPTSLVMRDKRRPVLYLRPFHSDNRVVGTLVPLPGYNGDVEGLETMDVALGNALREIGPPLAIGRPGERLPPGGADRMYTEGWQGAVMDLARTARLIVIMLADTPACRWEIRAILSAFGADRVLFVIPPKWKMRPGSVDHRVVWSELVDDYPWLPPIDTLTVAVGAPRGRLQIIQASGWGDQSFPLHERIAAISRAYASWRVAPGGFLGRIRLIAWRLPLLNPLRIVRWVKTAGARTTSRALARKAQ
jgi:hypothetical protein